MTQPSIRMGKTGTTLLLLGAAMFFGAYAWMTSETNQALEVRGVRTDATVVKYFRGQATLQFRDQRGNEVKAVTKEVRGTSRLRPGDVVPIVYDPEDPTGRVRDARHARDDFMVVLLWIAAASSGGLAALVALGVVNPARPYRR